MEIVQLLFLRWTYDDGIEIIKSNEHGAQNSEAHEHRTFFPVVRPKLHRSSTHIPPPGGTKALSIWAPQLLAWAGQPTWRLPGASSTRGRRGLPAAYLPAPSGLLLAKSKIKLLRRRISDE